MYQIETESFVTPLKAEGESFLLTSACRHAARSVSLPFGNWRTVYEDFDRVITFSKLNFLYLPLYIENANLVRLANPSFARCSPLSIDLTI